MDRSCSPTIWKDHTTKFTRDNLIKFNLGYDLDGASPDTFFVACKNFVGGWPIPDLGGLCELQPDIIQMRVYLDDMILCPKCGEFKIQETPNHFPKEPWIGRELEVDVEKVVQIAKDNLDRQQFRIEECSDGRMDLCKHTIEEYKKKFNRILKEKERQKQYENFKQQVRLESQEKEKRRSSPGLVYLIKAGMHVKIGSTKELKKRLSQLQIGNPHKLEVLKTWETKNEADWEKKLHDIFISRRVSGEWFNLTKSQLNKLLAAYTVEGAVAKFR